MAIVKIISSGNWSNPAIFSTGIPPTSSDDVICNGFISTCDITITINSLRNDTTGSSTIGGKVLMGNGSNLTCRDSVGVVTGNGVAPVEFNLLINESATLNASIQYTYTVNGTTLILISGIGTVYLIGNYYQSTNTNITTRTIFISGNATVNIFGNGNSSVATAVIPSTVVATIIQISSSATVNVFGNYTGGLGINANASAILQQGGGTLTINGNINGGGEGSNSGCYGVYSTNGNVIVNGMVNAGQSSAIYCSGFSTIDVTGIISASFASPALIATNINTLVTVDGPIINYLGKNAIYSGKIAIKDNPIYWVIKSTIGTTRTLFSEDQLTGIPYIGNVRLGVQFGQLGTLFGTMNVPTPNNVSLGVPIDNTVGTADFSAMDLLAGINASSDPLAIRLKNVSTVGTVGSQLTSYNI